MIREQKLESDPNITQHGISDNEISVITTLKKIHEEQKERQQNGSDRDYFENLGPQGIVTKKMVTHLHGWVTGSN